MHLNYRFVISILVALACCASLFAAGDTTGSISGRITDPGGAPLPGVTVTISGPYLPAGRTAVTGADGMFTFQQLLPGPYDVTAELAGLGKSRQRVTVEVGKDTQVTQPLTQSVTETITVSAARPVVDVKSTEAQQNFKNDFIEKLPIGRDYAAMFELAPGVASTTATSPNAGGNRQDNTYLVDGINITNPFFANFFTNIPEINIQEVNIKRGGVTAEFGRTAGMVVNAVTKSGTNDLRGEARFEYAPSSFISDPKGSTGALNKTDRSSPALDLSGPVFRDRAWFYVSGSFPYYTTTDRTNNTGALPDAKRNTNDLFGKVTINPTMNQFINASIRSRKVKETNQGMGVTGYPSVGLNSHTDDVLGNIDYSWNLTSRSFINAKANHYQEQNTQDVLNDLGYLPTPFDPTHLERMGNYTFHDPTLNQDVTVGGSSDAINNQNYHRNEFRGEFQSMQSWFGMSHDLRIGGRHNEGGEDLARRSNGWGTITIRPNGQIRARAYTEQPMHRGKGKTDGVFAQDQITAWNRVTLNVGVAADRDRVFGGDGNQVIGWNFKDEIQPRVGLSFVLDPAAGDKLYANFGKYMVVDNMSLGRAASRTRIYRTDFFFDPKTGALLNKTIQASTTTKTVDAGIKPTYQNEWVAGYARPIGALWSAEVWGMYRNMHNFIEDASKNDTGNGPFHVEQLVGAKRNYEALTLESSRATNGAFMNLAMNFSYTWSKLYGNWDLDYADGGLFYNSSYLQDGPGLLVTDNRNGILLGDRTHVLKLFATVNPIKPLTLGTYLRYQSGAPWEARDFESDQSGLWLKYAEPAGSRRMPSWWNFDLLTSYRIPVGFADLEAQARIVNLFNKQAVMSVDSHLTTFDVKGNLVSNPNFGNATTYSAPRTIIVSAIVRY